MIFLFLVKCFLLTFLIHRLTIALKLFSSRQRGALYSGLLAMLGSIVFQPESVGMLGWLLSATSAHLYFHVFNMSETARRIKCLLQIQKGVDPRAAYSPNEIVDKRIVRLLELGVIEKRDGELRLKKRALALLSMFLTRYEWFLFPERARLLRGALPEK